VPLAVKAATPRGEATKDVAGLPAKP